jgi:hypothetical protein
MKYLLASALTLLVFSLPAKAQVVPDCSNCTTAEWGAEYNPATGGCASNPIKGCGNGCNCQMGFMAVITVRDGKATAKADVFGGAFTTGGGFRIDRPGPLARNRVKPGDVAYRINGRKPRRTQLGTPRRPIRRAEATWNDNGQLLLRLWR